MTGKSDFKADEWELVLGGPPSAGILVATAQRGGTFRETFSIAKAYVEARKQHGDSQLLDEIAATKPQIDHTRYHSVEELEQATLAKIRDGVATVEAKGTPEEVEEYRKFIVGLAERVAEAHREGFMGLSGERVSDAEKGAIAKIQEAAGGTGA
jgi:hypothetical protein